MNSLVIGSENLSISLEYSIFVSETFWNSPYFFLFWRFKGFFLYTGGYIYSFVSVSVSGTASEFGGARVGALKGLG